MTGSNEFERIAAASVEKVEKGPWPMPRAALGLALLMMLTGVVVAVLPSSWSGSTSGRRSLSLGVYGIALIVTAGAFALQAWREMRRQSRRR